MDLLLLIGGILAVLVGIVFFVLSYSSWRWLHWLTAIFVLLAAASYLPLAAGVFHVRTHWIKQVATLQQQLQRQEAEVALLRDGREIRGTESQKVQPSLADLRAQLERINFGRGRIWQGLSPGNVGQTVQLTRGGAEGAPDAPPPAAGGELIAPGMIVYAFREDQSGPTPLGRSFRVPRVFLGEFQVESADAGSVTLSPTLSLAPWQIASMRQASDSTGQPSRWTLMEAAPLDDPEALVLGDNPEQELRQLIPSLQDLQNLLPKAVYAPTKTDAEYQARLQRIRDRMEIDYLYNLKPLAAIRAQYPWFDPESEELADSRSELVWHRVTLAKPYSVKVDNAPADRDPTRPQYFNDAGEAINSLLYKAPIPLKNDGTFDYEAIARPDFKDAIQEFAAETTLLLPASEATRLVDQGIARPPAGQDDIVYIRPLRDYPYLFHALATRATQVTNSIATMNLKITNLQRALADLEGGAGGTGRVGQIALRQSERDKLAGDLSKMREEVQKLEAIAGRLDTDVSGRVERLATLRQQNLALVRDYAQRQRELAEENESRLRSADARP